MTFLTARPLILLLVLCLLAIGLVMVLDTPAEAHSPPCRSAYPWIRYRLVEINYPGTPVYFIAYFYNASTGATHSHTCQPWQI